MGEIVRWCLTADGATPIDYDGWYFADGLQEALEAARGKARFFYGWDESKEAVRDRNADTLVEVAGCKVGILIRKERVK